MASPSTASATGDNGFNLVLVALASAPQQMVEHRPQGRPRAPRFVIRVPTRYRVLGTDEWDRGETANLSESGAAFETSRSDIDFIMAPSSADGIGVEMVLEVPAPDGASSKTVFSCWGVIARVSRGCGPGTLTDVAISLRSPYVPGAGSGLSS